MIDGCFQKIMQAKVRSLNWGDKIRSMEILELGWLSITHFNMRRKIKWTEIIRLTCNKGGSIFRELKNSINFLESTRNYFPAAC